MRLKAKNILVATVRGNHQKRVNTLLRKAALMTSSLIKTSHTKIIR